MKKIERPEGALTDEAILALIERAHREKIEIQVYTVAFSAHKCHIHLRGIDSSSVVKLGNLTYHRIGNKAPRVVGFPLKEDIFIFDNYWMVRAFALSLRDKEVEWSEI